MRFLYPALLALTVVSVQAQQATPTPERSRLVFPTGTKDPLLTPRPAAPAAQAPQPKGSPAEIIERFFTLIKIQRIDEAYDSLVQGTIIADRSQDVANLKEQTKNAVDAYGPIAGYEQLDSQAVGSALARYTVLSLNSDLPLRWRFYFYKTGDAWKLVDIRIDDGLVELFEDSSRPRR